MNIKQLTNEEFNNFIKECDIKSFYQTPEYGFLMNKQNFDSILIGLIRKDKIIAATLILKNKTKAFAPRGFLLNYADADLFKAFTILLKDYLPKIGVKEITISPLVIKNTINSKEKTHIENPEYTVINNNLENMGFKHLIYNNSFEETKPRFEAIIDIDKPYYNLFNNINKEIRTKIRNAEKTGITVHKGTIDELNYLYSHTKKKYPRDLKYFKNCYKIFDKTDSVDYFYTTIDFKENLKFCNSKYIKAEAVSEVNNEKLQFIKNEKAISTKINSDKELISCKEALKKAMDYNNKYPNGVVSSSVMIIKHFDEVYMLIDGFDKNYKSFNSKHLLIWKLIEKYSNEGFKKFNLGGMATPNSKNRFEGLNNFKLSFNSTTIEYIGDYKLTLSNSHFKKHEILKKILKK